MQPGSRPDREVESAPPSAVGAQGNGEGCVLCGSTRRSYLFVVGRSRMTRCSECQLVVRSDEGRGAVEAEAYGLDDDSELTIRAMLAPADLTTKRRLLCVADRGGARARLHDDSRLDVTVKTTSEALANLPDGAFDAVFVNGSIENTNPIDLLRRLRAALRPGGDIVIAVCAPSTVRDPLLPRYAFSTVPLTRATLAAGFRTVSCGILSRAMETPVRDERLTVRDVPLARAAHFVEALGRRVEVPSGLLVMHARAEAPPACPKVSIVVPVYNEARTFEKTFERVYGARVAGVEREIVVVESNSTDGSRELVKKVEGRPGVVTIFEDRPRGKGHAVRAAIAASTGEFVLIQDADSEYDVGDYDIVLEPLLALTTTFVLGSRHLGARTWKIRDFGDEKALAFVMNLAHESFTVFCNLLYDTSMHDPATMYKVFRRDAYRGIQFTRDCFDFDWELVCKLVRRGHFPVEVPVNYQSRSYAEGKKVRFFRDPITWVETIVACRFEPLGEH